MLQCGKSQIAQILKNKEYLLAMFESNASENYRALTSKTSHKSEYVEVNKALYEWYTAPTISTLGAHN